MLLLGLTLSGLACSSATTDESCIALEVGTQRLTLGEVERDLDFLLLDGPLPRAMSAAERERLVQTLADHYLILEYARENGIGLDPHELEQALAGAVGAYTRADFDQELLKAGMAPEEWRRRFSDLLLEAKVVAHVLARVEPLPYEPPSGEPEAQAESGLSWRRFRQVVVPSRLKAEELQRRIRKGEDFGPLAREFSTGPEADRAGEVGWVGQGQLDPSMDKVLFDLEPHTVGPVVKSPYGYHIFEVLEVRRGSPPAQDQQPVLVDERQRRASMLRPWLEDLRTRYGVKIYPRVLDRMESG